MVILERKGRRKNLGSFVRNLGAERPLLKIIILKMTTTTSVIIARKSISISCLIV